MARPIAPRPAPSRPRVALGAVVGAVTLSLVLAPIGCASQGAFRPSVAENSSQSGDSSKDGQSGSKSESSNDSSDGSSGAVAVGVGVLVLIGVVYLVVIAVEESDAGPARAYLESHRRPIRVSLARGSGPFVDDVAAALKLPAAQVDLLGRTLHAHREALDGWLRDPEITTTDLSGFAADLGAALASEPALALDVARTRARLEAAFGR